MVYVSGLRPSGGKLTDPPTVPCHQLYILQILKGLPKLGRHPHIPSREHSIPRRLLEVKNGTSIHLLPTTPSTLGHRAIPSCKGSWDLEVAMTRLAEEFRWGCALACVSTEVGCLVAPCRDSASPHIPRRIFLKTKPCCL